MLKIAFLVLTVVLVAVVAVFGRRPERAVAMLLVMASLASPMVETNGFVSLEVGIMVIDIAVLAFLLTVALVSNRFWPLWAAGFQLVAVLVHVARISKHNVWFFAYSSAEIFWAYPVYLALIVGTLAEARHRPR